jgi:hypothetical protein
MNEIDAVSKVEAVQQNLKKVQDAIKPLEDVDFSTLISKVDPLEAGTINIAIAYTLAVMYHTSLNLKGGAESNHPIFDELKRIQQYINKSGECKKAIEQKNKKRKITINKDASRRVILQKLSEK